jgi:uncharacterized RDD family membrane protein YckC
LAALPYEGLLILALLLIAAFPVAGLEGAALAGASHLAFQIYLAAVAGVYYVWFWSHGGQTLPMKTWRFRITRRDGRPLGAGRALARFLIGALIYLPACTAVVLCFFAHRVPVIWSLWLCLPMAATVLWARFDTDGQFLHDRLAGTRLASS